MIGVDEALATVLAEVRVLPEEKVPITSALRRVLAEDVAAEADIPPFDNSAMDGYAVRAVDTRGASRANPVVLEVLEDLAAGRVSTSTIGPGQAIRIMTGAPTPAGADSIVMVEETERGDGTVRIFTEARLGEHVRLAGEDVKRGQVVLPVGRLLRAADIGMLASVGKAEVSVIGSPKVAIITTGDELVDLTEPLAPGKIRNSNAYSLAAQVIESGGVPEILGIARDTHEDVREKIERGLESDIVLTSGGVSVGDYDLVKDVLGGLGRMVFWKVAMKPAKPLAFGILKGKPAFGLPGNPTSSMVSFEQFVRPTILKMSGHKTLHRPEVEVILGETVRKKAGRRHFLRVMLERRDGELVALLTGPQGSGILKSMTLADGLLVLPEDATEVKQGEKAKVQLFNPDVALGHDA